MNIKRSVNTRRLCILFQEVEAIRREEIDAFAALEAYFQQELYQEHQNLGPVKLFRNRKNPRGIYAGAIGYIDFSGNMDTCIAIRMAVKEKDRVCVQTGAELLQIVSLKGI